MSVIMEVPYDGFKYIYIKGNTEYIIAISSCLVELASLPSGPAFLKELDAGRKKITITKDERPNRCSPNDERAAGTLFAKAITDKNKSAFLTELKKAINDAINKKRMSKNFLVSQLSYGLSPIEQRSVYSNVSPTQWGIQSHNRFQGPEGKKTKSALSLLINFINLGRYFDVSWTTAFNPGTVKSLMENKQITSNIQRILRKSLEEPLVSKGPGSACTVYFDPANKTHKHKNATTIRTTDAINRPAPIGLSHEFVHALRAVHGLWTSDDDIEEGLAVGLPPFNFETYSENLFRKQYETKLGKKTPLLRKFYSDVKFSQEGYLVALEEYLDYLKIIDEKTFNEYIRWLATKGFGASAKFQTETGVIARAVLGLLQKKYGFR